MGLCHETQQKNSVHMDLANNIMNTRIVCTVPQCRMIHYIATRLDITIRYSLHIIYIYIHVHVHICATIPLTIHCGDNPMEIWRTRVDVIRH